MNRGSLILINTAKDLLKQEGCPSATAGAVPHRAGSHRGLPPALGAFIGPRLGVELPCLAVTALGTDEAVRPARLRQISGARGFIGEPPLKFEEGPREIGHGEHRRGPYVRFMFY